MKTIAIALVVLSLGGCALVEGIFGQDRISAIKVEVRKVCGLIAIPPGSDADVKDSDTVAEAARKICAWAAAKARKQ